MALGEKRLLARVGRHTPASTRAPVGTYLGSLLRKISGPRLKIVSLKLGTLYL